MIKMAETTKMTRMSSPGYQEVGLRDGGGGGTPLVTQYWGGGGTSHFFLVILYNFKNTGGGMCPPWPPYFMVPVQTSSDTT